jgi:hypothetical protein
VQVDELTVSFAQQGPAAPVSAVAEVQENVVWVCLALRRQRLYRRLDPGSTVVVEADSRRRTLMAHPQELTLYAQAVV